MPALPPIAHCAKSIYRGDCAGKPFSTSLTWHYAGAWDPTDVQALNGVLITKWVARLNPVLGADFEIQEIESVDLASLATPVELTSGGGHGTGPGSTLPINNTFDVYWPAGSRYRGGHCHSFLAGFTINDLGAATNTWDGAMITHVQNWSIDVHAVLNDPSTYPTLGALQHGTVHYRGPVALGPYPRFETVAAGVMSSKVHGRTRRLGR